MPLSLGNLKLRGRLRAEAARLRRANARNWAELRARPWQELSGAFGDLGTFVPIFVALAQQSGGVISVSSTLVFSGLANLLTGLFFGIPLPVQPMKAIASVALANPSGAWNGMDAAQLAAAGIFVAACVGFLAVTGLLHLFTRAVPVPVVKGIQVGAGLTLAMKAFGMLGGEFNYLAEDWELYVKTLLFAVLFTAMLAFAMFPRVPFTLLVVSVLSALMMIHGLVVWITKQYGWDHVQFSLWQPLPLLHISPNSFLMGAAKAGLGQLPLTTLNSVVAVVYLAEDLFPDFETPSATSIGLSVMAMNLVGCWFRAMPVCHGSGGLAAQYRFGARSGASVVFLGTLKLLLGLFASEFALWFCDNFPRFLLAFLLFLAGQELVKMGESINGKAARDLWEEAMDETSDDVVDGIAGREGRRRGRERRKVFKAPSDEERMRRWHVMTATVVGVLGARNDGVGFIAGIAMHRAYALHDWWIARAARRADGQIRLPEEEHSV